MLGPPLSHVPSSLQFMLHCICLLLALSGLAEMACKLSALRGEADMRDRVTSTSSVAIDPQANISGIEIPQRSSFLGVLFFLSEARKYESLKRRDFIRRS